MIRVLSLGLEDHQLRRLVPALERAGFEVLSMPDERQALEMLRSQPLDLVVAGPQASAKWIERTVAFRPGLSVPLIAIMPLDDTGCGRLAALDSGADDCLSEPVDPGELVARIRAILRRQSGLAEEADAWPVGRPAVEVAGLTQRSKAHSPARIEIIALAGSAETLTGPVVALWHGLGPRVAQAARAMVGRLWGASHDPMSRRPS